MILTQQIAEIQRFISEQGAFPFVIVWVQQQGAHVIPMPETHNLALVFMGINICTLLIILACTNFNLVLVFSHPTTHLFMMMKMQ